MDAAAGEECIACDEEGIRALTRQSGKDRIDFANRSGVEDVELQPDRAGSLLHISQCGFNNRSIGRVEEHGNAQGLRHQFMQEC